jgi:hypothetical protein
LEIKNFKIKKIGQKDIDIEISVEIDQNADKKKYFKNSALSDWTWDRHLTLDIEYIGKYYR